MRRLIRWLFHQTDFGDVIQSFVGRGSELQIRFSDGSVTKFKVREATPDSVIGYFQFKNADAYEPQVSILNPDQITAFRLI